MSKTLVRNVLKLPQLNKLLQRLLPFCAIFSKLSGVGGAFVYKIVNQIFIDRANKIFISPY